MFTGVMSEDALIRYTNLEALCAARNWGPSELAQHIDRSVSQASDMLRRQKTFGEKIARYIEQRLDLPRGWLDTPHDPEEVEAAGRVIAAREKSAVYQVGNVVQLPSNEPHPPNSRGAHTLDTPLFGVSPAKNVARAPVVVWARLGEDLHKSNQLFRDDDQRFYTGQADIPARSKFVTVPDDSLAPKILRGDFVLIDPDNLQPGRDRVALFSGPDGAFFLRRYRPLANGDFEAYDEAGRTLEGVKHGIKVEGTFVTMQRDEV